MENERLDGYESAEDAAAGYMSDIGWLRVAMHQAVKDIEAGNPTGAAERLREADRKWRLERAKVEVPIVERLAVKFNSTKTLDFFGSYWSDRQLLEEEGLYVGGILPWEHSE